MKQPIRPAIPSALGTRQVLTADALEKSLARIDLDGMLAQFAGSEDGEAVDTFIKEQAAEREQIAALAAAFASDPAYRPLYEWLLDITVRRPLVVWGLGANRLEYVDRREGANSVIWQLLAAVAEGRKEPPPTREGTNP